MITSFAEILLKIRNLPKCRVAVAVAEDDAVLEAVKGAQQQEIADFTLVGDQAKIECLADKLAIDLSRVLIIDQPDNQQAAYEAVKLVSGGQADVLMKGMINTADLLKAVLNKEVGLRSGRILSHVAVLEIAGFDRLIMITDGGMNIQPSVGQKAQIIQNTVDLAQALDIKLPKVACLAAVEVVNPDMASTVDAAALSKMADRGQIRGALVEGPLALDNAVSLLSAQHKNITGPVAGLADILLVPNIEVGNVLGKSLVYFAQAQFAGLVLGATHPIIVTSRADSFKAKILSIALGALFGKAK